MIDEVRKNKEVKIKVEVEELMSNVRWQMSNVMESLGRNVEPNCIRLEKKINHLPLPSVGYSSFPRRRILY